MKLARLDLQAFGPFDDVRLDLGDPDVRLHVVYGPNEAGKSSALRAIGALLYGFPHQSPDAHRHPPSALRVGGRLVPRAGDALEVVRRKGRKDTLLDPAGAPIDEARLTSVLGGASAQSFHAMFGLDHESLRRGAEALLAGGGDVGESLFDAALGGRGVHHLLAELRDEAAALYKPKATKARIPMALAAVRHAQKETKEALVGAEAWEQQVADLEAAEAAQARRVERLRALEAAREHQRRLARVHRHVLARDRADAALAELGPVTPVPDGTRARREEVEARLRDAGREAELRAAQLARLRQDLGDLPPPASIGALPEAEAADLRDRLGSLRDAVARRPAREADVARRREEIRGRLRLLERDGDVDEVLDALRPVLASRGRLKRLAREGHDRLGARARATEELRQAREALRRAEAALAGAPPPDPAALTALLQRVRADGGPRAAGLPDLERRVAHLEAEVASRLRALGRPDGDPAALVEAATPTPAEVETRRRAVADRAAARTRHAEAVRAADARLGELEGALEALGAAGEVPTEEALHAARARRDEAVERLRFTWKARGNTLEADAALDAVAAGIARVDALADRLRRETERVEKAAAKTAEARRVRASREGDAEAVAALDREEREATAAWEESWRRAGVEAGPPEAMAAWLEEREALARTLGELADARAEREGLRGREAETERALREALSDAGEDTLPAGLDALWALAERRERAWVDAARARAAAEGDAGEARDAVTQLEGRLGDGRAAVETWREAWGPAVAPLGLGAEADPDDATDRVDAAAELLALHDALREREAELRSADADVAALAADVDRLAAEHAVTLPEGRVAERADALLRAARDAREALERRRRLEARVAEAARELAEREDVIAVASRELEALVARVGVGDRDALVEAEARAERHEALRRARDEAHEQLLQDAEGEDPEALAAAARAGRAEAFRAEAEALGGEVEALRDEKQAEDQRVGQLRSGLEHLRARAGAATAAERTAAAAARAAREIDRYVQVHVAVRALAAEIDRYRDENQGPVIRRASALFPRLTGGRYAQLVVSFDGADRPRLEAVRGDGARVGVDGLSDGTRDQLYLALRLATLERWAERREPLPLILDDAFVHFDRERVRAAVGVLGEVPDDQQVLLFTHHDFVVDVAREAVPAARLAVHALNPSPVATATAGDAAPPPGR